MLAVLLLALLLAVLAGTAVHQAMLGSTVVLAVVLQWCADGSQGEAPAMRCGSAVLLTMQGSKLVLTRSAVHQLAALAIARRSSAVLFAVHGAA